MTDILANDTTAHVDHHVHNGSAPKWREEHDAHLKHCRLVVKLTFKECATSLNRKFKTGFTRHACIGRAMRLGLTVTQASIPKPVRKQRARRTYGVIPAIAPESISVQATADRKPPAGSIAFKAIHAIKAMQNAPNLERDTRPLRCAEIEPKHLTLMQLQPDSCRWPYGGWPGATPITFCGHFALEGSYCDAHRALSHSQRHDVSEEGRARIGAARTRTNGKAARLGPFDASEISDFGA